MIAETPIAAMVQQMLAAGASTDMITLAVSTAEECLRAAVSAEIPRTKADISAERRRAADRERKAAVRGNPQNSPEIPQTPKTASTLREVRAPRTMTISSSDRSPARRPVILAHSLS
jgi:hypothetical protein